jgi:DNA-binding NarL/FixJ family response regulator
LNYSVTFGSFTLNTIPAPAGITLTAREKEVLALILKGHPNKTIARELDLAEKTIKFYVGQLLLKYEARNRLDLALIARRA